MAKEIVFKVTENLRKIIAHAKKAKKCMEPYNLAVAKEPMLWLVKDHGIYLMSAGVPRQKKRGKPVVEYAIDFDLDKDNDFDACFARQQAISRGDFCEGVPVKDVQEAIFARAYEVIFRISKTKFELAYRSYAD
jgi:hypothetical protein